MDNIIVPILFLIGFTLKYRYSALDARDHILLDQLFFYHMIMSFIYYIYANVSGGDAHNYWHHPKYLDFSDILEVAWNLKHASFYIYIINYIPSKLLDLSFYTGFVIYGVLGYWGFIYLLLIIKRLIPQNYYLKHIKILNIAIYPSILFLPNLHFWSSGIGKDTILFFAVCASIYGIITFRRNWFILIPSFILAYTIRPHILLFLLSGMGLSYLLKSRLFMFQKVIIILIGIAVFIPMLQNILEFAKIEDASIESFSEFSQTKAKHLGGENAGSSVNIEALPYPLKVFTFLYRPLFFDASNVLSILASFENLIWLVLSVNFFMKSFIKVLRDNNYIVMGAFFYWIIGALAFAPVLGNLGIIIRERNMFLPAFILFTLVGLANESKFRKIVHYYQLKKMEYLAYSEQMILRNKR